MTGTQTDPSVQVSRTAAGSAVGRSCLVAAVVGVVVGPVGLEGFA